MSNKKKIDSILQLTEDLAATHKAFRSDDASASEALKADRLAVTCQYCEPWLRPQENFFLELSQNTLSQMSEPLLSMVGYSIHPPFMGMVNGMHPKRTLQREDA